MFHNISKNILITEKKAGERLKLASKTLGITMQNSYMDQKYY